MQVAPRVANDPECDALIMVRKMFRSGLGGNRGAWGDLTSLPGPFSLRAKGRPIPTNDIWIAAHVMETGADLVSADRHFEHVDGIAWLRLKADRRQAPPPL